MSTDLYAYSIQAINWEQFYDYLHDSLPQLGLEEIDEHPYDDRSIWLRQKEKGLEIRLSLIHRIDPEGFFLEEASRKLQLPLESDIIVALYTVNYFENAARAFQMKDHFTLELLCIFADQWPIVVHDNHGTYYTNAELRQRLAQGQGIIPRAT